jgi:hypothetical protein
MARATTWKSWTPQDDQVIRTLAGTMSWAEVAEVLGRGVSATAARASKLRIPGRKQWNNSVILDTRTCGGILCSNEFSAVTYNGRFCSAECRASGHILNRYNLTKERYVEILDDQGWQCLCGRTDVSSLWHVDHDHSCCPERKKSCGSCVRGIICSTCNTGLGFAKDNPETLRAWIEYLEK